MKFKLTFLFFLFATVGFSQGDTRDKHGCLPSAGYTWSIVKGKCVRIWEDGISVSCSDSTRTDSPKCYILFNKSKNRAELFGKSPVQILKLKKKNLWGNKNYTLLKKENADYILKEN